MDSDNYRIIQLERQVSDLTVVLQSLIGWVVQCQGTRLDHNSAADLLLLLEQRDYHTTLSEKPVQPR